MTEFDDYVLTYTSDTFGKGGQHTNGPDYGIYRCEHVPTKTAVEVHTHNTRSPHRAREFVVELCAMVVSELNLRGQ